MVSDLSSIKTFTSTLKNRLLHGELLLRRLLRCSTSARFNSSAANMLEAQTGTLLSTLKTTLKLPTRTSGKQCVPLKESRSW